MPLEVAGEQLIGRNVVDLIQVIKDTMEIVDYKTGLGRYTGDEYRMQLSVYWYVLNEVYPDGEVKDICTIRLKVSW